MIENIFQAIFKESVVDFKSCFMSNFLLRVSTVKKYVLGKQDLHQRFMVKKVMWTTSCIFRVILVNESLMTR